MYNFRPAMSESEGGNLISAFISNFEREDLNGKLSQMSKLSSSIEEACSGNQVEAIEYYYQINCHVFLSAESKSPLKQYSARSLMKFPPEHRTGITKYLSRNLINLMKSNHSFRVKHSLNKICDCFDNFPIGVDAVSLCLEEVLCHLCLCLRHTLENLSDDLSPMEQNELIATTHSALRGTVTVLQKFGSRTKASVENNCVAEIKCLQDIVYACTELLNHDLIPMDSKLNCGLVIVILCSVMCNNGYDVVLGKLISDNSSTKDASFTENINFKSNLAQMSVCYGLLNIMPLLDLCKCDVNGKKYFMDVIFRKLVALSESTDNNLCLGCSRALQQAVLILHTGAIKNSSPECLEMLKSTDILTLCMEFVWVSLDHYVDCVRHAAKTILLYLLQIADFMHNKDKSVVNLGDVIIDIMGKLPSHKKSKYIALAVLANEFGFRKLKEVFPDLVSTLLEVLEDLSMSSHASNAYEVLMMKNFKEENEAQWVLTWIFPLFEAYRKSNVGYIVESIIAKAMTICPSLLDHVLATIDDDDLKSSKLKVVIVCLKTGAKLGLLEKKYALRNNVNMWKGIIKYETLMLALVNCDDDIRLDALSLVVESNKTTQKFDALELQLVKCFLWYNVNSDSLSLKQKTLMLQKKVLTRIRESAYPLTKIMKTKKDNDPQVTDARETLQAYTKFLKWLYDFSFKCLFPGANATRRASALEILVLLDEIFSSSNSKLMVDDGVKLFALKGNETYANLLLSCLKDSFESSKNLAFNILMKFPEGNLNFKEQAWIDEYLCIGLKLASSVKPPDCITAAYIIKFLVSLPEAEIVLFDKASNIVSSEYFPDLNLMAKDTSFHQRSALCMILILFEQLKKELAVASQNLLLAAGSGPMYGTLFSIRHLLKILDWNVVAENPLWRSLILELISLCFKINEAVIHIVNSSSPEGHLPMDFEPATHHGASSKFGIPDLSCDKNPDCVLKPPVTAQMVLLCSWRTVKEVSLFLGEISFQAPIQEEMPGKCIDCYLLSEELVMRIGEHFTKLLSETKHRGAFEQAYVGFCQLCRKLWRHPTGILSGLPKLWLKDILSAITQGKKSSKLCATRRSAGVPFIVQALVTTEIDVRQPTALRESMDILFDLLENTGGENEETNEQVVKIESRTHAMNILRALFRHTLLGEFVTPYVARGVMAAIKGFKGHTWAERNSATLLFGALIIRIFGVKHSRDDTHRKNRMTGRVFFDRYPLLYNFILEELKVAADVSPQGDHLQAQDLAPCIHPSLFPLLVLLSRLYPSSLEGTDSNMQLSAFIPPLKFCLKSKIYKIRELAARAMVPLIPSNAYVRHLDETFHGVISTEEEQNHLNGVLLEISMLLLEIPYPQKETGECLSNYIDSWINASIKILTSGPNFSFMVKEAYVRVLRHLLFISSSSVGSLFSEALWNRIYGFLEEHIKELITSSDISVCLPNLGGTTWIQRATQLLLEIAVVNYHSSEMLVTILCSLLANYSLVPCVTVALSFISSVFGDDMSECDEEEDGLPLFEWPKTKDWLDKVQAYQGDFLLDRNLALASVNFVLHSSDSYLMQKAVKVIGHLAISSLGIEWQKANSDSVTSEINPFSYLVDLCQTEPENVGRAALFCLSAMIHEVVGSDHEVCLTTKTGSVFCDLLQEFSSADKSELSRLVVAEALVNNHPMLCEKVFHFSTWDQCRAWVVLFDLLGDHSKWIRETAAKLSNKFKFSDALLKTSPDHQDKSFRRSSTAENCWEGPKVPVRDHLADVHPERLKELVIFYFGRVFGSSNKYECVITLLALILRDDGSDEPEDNINEERVFDKGEANLFAEWLTPAKICAQLLSEIVDDSVVRDSLPIPSSIMSLIGLEGSEASSVLDLLELALTRINHKIETCEKVDGLSFNTFLTPGYDAIQKEAFRVGLALTALKKNSFEVYILCEGFFKRLAESKILSTFSVLCE